MSEERLRELENIYWVPNEAVLVRDDLHEACREIRRCWAEINRLEGERGGGEAMSKQDYGKGFRDGVRAAWLTLDGARDEARRTQFKSMPGYDPPSDVVVEDPNVLEKLDDAFVRDALGDAHVGGTWNLEEIIKMHGKNIAALHENWLSTVARCQELEKAVGSLRIQVEDEHLSQRYGPRLVELERRVSVLMGEHTRGKTDA